MSIGHFAAGHKVVVAIINFILAILNGIPLGPAYGIHTIHLTKL
jgi:membrane-associated protease RseP (regulator of RpoE activity)